MRRLLDHPVLLVVSAGITLLSIVSGVGTGVYFVMDIRNSLDDDSRRLIAIRGEQEQIRRELATQTVSLDEIRDEQDQIAARQRWLSSDCLLYTSPSPRDS